MNIDTAKEFVLNKVIIPAIESDLINDEIKNRVKHSRKTINAFKKIGDLYDYLSRFTGKSDDVYLELERQGLNTFESILSEFTNKFIPFLDQKTNFEDFIIGNSYSAWDIAFCAKTYDIKNGIYLNTIFDGRIASILIKATFEGGRYKNEWIIKGNKLKYYFYSRNGKYTRNDSTNFQFNEAIITNNVPILVFQKLEKNNYIYEGIFKYNTHIINKDGSRFFILDKCYGINETYSKIAAERFVEYNIRAPKKITINSEQYIRDPKVVEETLKRSNGICEKCYHDAPFKRRSDGIPYLEVHHLKPLSAGGLDNLENTIALCPNCHKEMHYG